MTSTKISGWGASRETTTHLYSVGSTKEAARIIASNSDGRGSIARGLGRSYGDASYRTGGNTLRLSGTASLTWVDQQLGHVLCPSHVSIGELIRFAGPAGFFVPVVPGTKHVTIGGAIAADVHGKNHHVAGSFANHVTSIRLLTPQGEVLEVSRSDGSGLFEATCGGMGLTGVILDATVALREVPGNMIAVDTILTPDLVTTAAALSELDNGHEYTVAWLDLTQGPNFGRGVVNAGNHSDRRSNDPTTQEIVSVPRWWRLPAVHRNTVRVFNRAWYLKASRSSTSTIEGYDSFFFPLDAVGRWNRLYGKRGFLQYQFVVDSNRDTLEELVHLMADGPSPISLAVLKRFGPGNNSPLSFPTRGWSLAVDIPIPRDPLSLERTLATVDETVADLGGRVYLAKDSRLRRTEFDRMYPEAERFRELRKRIDPAGLLQSDLAVRLGL